MEVGRLFGFLYPAFVHFPIVLLIVSVGLDAAGFFLRDARYAWAARALLLLGMLFLLVAFVAGNFAELWAAWDGIPQDPVEQHEFFATLTSWSFVFLAAFRLALGAGGHCVALSEDSQRYLHTHPIDASGSRFGPSVTFHTLFTRPGVYKVWGQFQHQGQRLTADFVLRVEP